MKRSAFFEKLFSRSQDLTTSEMRVYFERLLREKGFLETIFNTLQEGVVALDATGRIEYFNKAALRLLAMDEAQAPGSPIQRYLRDLDWPSLLQQGHASSRVMEMSYPERRVLEFYLVPVEGVESGSARAAFMAIFHDITQARAMTQDAIETERLDAIRLLAAGVAHELGNPLNSLNIHLQLMERDAKHLSGEESERILESVRVARAEIERLDNIISQFLRAIRPAKPDLVPGNIQHVIELTLQVLKQELENREILVEIEGLSLPPEVEFDAAQMQQAFYNIIRNAIQAIGDRGILHIKLESGDAWLSINFTDSGSGISPEDLPHVFQPYYTTKERGNGLGLMIVQRIVREHGGALELESGKDRGTTVRIKLPLRSRRIHLLEERTGQP